MTVSRGEKAVRKGQPHLSAWPQSWALLQPCSRRCTSRPFNACANCCRRSQTQADVLQRSLSKPKDQLQHKATAKQALVQVRALGSQVHEQSWFARYLGFCMARGTLLRGLTASVVVQAMTGTDPAVLLPADVWRTIVLLGSPLRIWTVDAMLSQQVERALWAARLGSTCRSLRDTVQGADSACLWREMTVCGSFSGMSPTQLPGLHAALAKQARFATKVRLRGGSWDLKMLRSLVQAAAGVQRLELKNFNRASETITLAASWACEPCLVFHIEGQACMSLPQSVEYLDLILRREDLDPSLGPEQAQERLQVLLQPLCRLTRLTLVVEGWSLTAVQSAQLVDWLPSLRDSHWC